MHEAGWKNCCFTYDDVVMLGHGCGVPQYPQWYDQQLKKCQLLPRPYLENFEGDNGEKEKENGY